MRRALFVALLLALSACTEAATQDSTAPTSPPTTAGPTTSLVTSTVEPPVTSIVTPTSTQTPSSTPPTQVSTPGSYLANSLAIHLGFRSEIPDVTTTELETVALAILNEPHGWGRSGFSFVADESSELMVILAEGPAVDVLCLPLETGGIVNCQNGPVVALNADRWRGAFDEWDSTVDDYRRYVLNHEVGHLIGLRHPLERCPTPDQISALMEPQTTNLKGCVGNGIPLDWEVEWAQRRPAEVGPVPEWDGPRPSWPTPDS